MTCMPSHVVAFPSTGAHCTTKTANVTTRRAQRSHLFAGPSVWVRMFRLRVSMVDAIAGRPRCAAVHRYGATYETRIYAMGRAHPVLRAVSHVTTPLPPRQTGYCVPQLAPPYW